MTTYYVLICRECDPERETPMPFTSPAARGEWASAHTRSTGHDLWWVVDQTLSDQGDLEVGVRMAEVTINGRWTLKLPLHRDRGSWWDHWEEERLASMHRHLGEGDVMMYVGAEQGDMPALCASWGCDVMLVEPVARVWPNMREIFKANGLHEPLASFVGFAGATDRDAPTDLWGWPPESIGDVSDVEGFANLWERPDLPVITLNTLATRHPCVVTAVSIDVEGAELAVLHGAAALVLTELRPKVWLSIHPDFMVESYDSHPDEIHSLMAAHDYVGELLADVHEQHWLFTPKEQK